MVQKKFAVTLLVAALSLVLLDCAGQAPPGGGPVDAVPPRVVRTFPDTNAVHVATGKITLEFSKYVDRQSVEQAIFISPHLGNLEFNWSGREVEMKFTDSLKRNKTYVVTVGTDVRDVNAGNRMASGFTLAFSTGDSIDHGFIEGSVYDEKPEGVMIFAYALDGRKADTLDPARVPPDYVMQTGAEGGFTLANLAYGVYRLLAVRDQYMNYLYDRQVDQYGVTTGDITLSAAQPRISRVGFRLTQEDTTKPFLSSVRSIDRFQVAARFSEPMDTLSFGRAVFSLADTLGLRRVDIALAYLDRRNLSTAAIVTSTPLDSATTYRLRVGNVFDYAGNILDSAHDFFLFQGSNVRDTVRPALTVRGMADSARGFMVDEPLEIDFSKPVEHGPLGSAVTLADSARRPVLVAQRWLNPTDLLAVPHEQLMSAAWYRVAIVMDSVRDLRGIGYRDSVFHLAFRTIDLRTMGSIKGNLVDNRGGKGRFYLSASSVDLRPPCARTLRMEQPGAFVLDRLVEGKYVLSAFRDADSSGTYTYGLPYPFAPSERFVVYPDTVKVRARWDVEGVAIRFR